MYIKLIEVDRLGSAYRLLGIVQFCFISREKCPRWGEKLFGGLSGGAMSSGGECPTFTTASVASSAATRVQCVSLTL